MIASLGKLRPIKTILEAGFSASVQPLDEQSLSEAPYVLKSHETLRARTTLLSHSQISDTETVR